MWSTSVSSFLQLHVKSCLPNAWHRRWRLPLPVVRFWVEKAVLMLHGLPDATVTGFWVIWISSLNMFTHDRPTCVRNRLSAFLVVHGFSAPAGSCSSAVMLMCTLESLSPSCWWDQCIYIIIKLFRDFRRGTSPIVSIEWVLLVRSLPCPFLTTCHRSPDV